MKDAIRKNIEIKSFIDSFKKKNFPLWIDKLTFPRLFFLWMLSIIAFGFIYSRFGSGNSMLYSTIDKSPTSSLRNTIYFSFVTATTTGFGDIVPFGLFKFLAIIEVVLGMFLLAFVTSKLVSIKQDIILNELYEISFYENVTKLRSAMILFRQNINSLISDVEEGKKDKFRLRNLDNYISSLEVTLKEIMFLFTKRGDSDFIKKLDPLNKELVLNNVLMSLDKISELFNILKEKKISCTNDSTRSLIEDCIFTTDEILSKIKATKNFDDVKIADFRLRYNNILAKLKPFSK